MGLKFFTGYLDPLMVLDSLSPPLLSIIIATRNRISYAISAIQSILKVSDQRLELVVQDNSESRDLELYVNENIKDSRFRYKYIAEPLSMIDNFNAAVELSTGEYICLIGDDDGVNPEIIEAAAWAKIENLDSLSVRQSSYYLWPGTGLSSTLFTKVAGGSLSVEPFSGKIIQIDLEKELRALFRNGGLYYLSFNLPKAYHGLARRECFELIKDKTGNYFGGTSPDMFSSIAISCVAKRAAIIEYPLTIPGHCRTAENTHHVVKAHLRPFEDAPHFKNRGEYSWCDLVPRIFIGEAFWVDSGIAALRAMGREDLVRELNQPKLAAHCVGGYRGIMKPVVCNMFNGLRRSNKNRFIGFIYFIYGIFSGPGNKFVRRVWNRILLIIGIRSCHQFHDVKDMSECSQKLTSYLNENGYSFLGCVKKDD